MRDELDKKLVEKFPKIFADRYGSMQETCMCWGFECNDGWYSLINSLCECIQHYLDQSPRIHQLKANQVKEKYGTLHFYSEGGDDYTNGLISMTEYLSGSICECCGYPGKLINNGWWKVRCQKCLEEEKNYRNSLKQLKLKLPVEKDNE